MRLPSDPPEQPKGLPYRYHFAYFAGRVAGGSAFGNHSVSLANRIRSETDLELVAGLIREANPGVATVVILSWQRFEDGES